MTEKIKLEYTQFDDTGINLLDSIVTRPAIVSREDIVSYIAKKAPSSFYNGHGWHFVANSINPVDYIEPSGRTVKLDGLTTDSISSNHGNIEYDELPKSILVKIAIELIKENYDHYSFK